MNHFGRNFGRLVRTKRGEEGLSQQELAVRAFGDENRKARISDLENGKVRKPQQRTVDALMVALNLTPEEMEACYRAGPVNDEQVEALAARERDRAREFGIKERQLIALAQRHAQGNPQNFGTALIELERALNVARDEAEKGRRGSNISLALDAAIARIDAHNANGNLDAGQEALESQLEALDAEDQRNQAERLHLYEKGIAQAVLSRNANNACRFVLLRTDLEVSSRPEMKWNALQTAQSEWLARGRDKGLNFDLTVSIALALELEARASDAEQRGEAWNNLGLALWRLGERESGTTRLEEAATSFRNALKERLRSRVPLDWAKTQNNLGNALQILGARESGTDRLLEAVAAHHSALEEYTRTSEPLEWAAAQNNLGNALQSIGERANGTKRLEETVVAYRSALESYTRTRTPLEWATTLNNLGTVLKALGEREDSSQRLKEAITVYYDALEERTRRRVPLDWAMTQNNLGNALRILGERENSTERLEEAITAYRSALEERDRERVPLYWATTQMNLGNALAKLGEQMEEARHLREASNALRNARTVYIDEAGQRHHESYFNRRIEEVETLIATLKANDAS